MGKIHKSLDIKGNLLYYLSSKEFEIFWGNRLMIIGG